MSLLETKSAEKPLAGPVLTKAVVRASDFLGVSSKALAAIIGVSEATVSRMRSGAYVLESGSKPFEMAVLFVRLFRSLDAMTGGEHVAARSWMASQNLALKGVPAEMIQTVIGLTNAIAYLDAHRARV